MVLPATLFGAIRKSDRAEVVPETSTRYFPAQVSIVDRVIDAASGTFGVRLELRNPEEAIPAGARCDCGSRNERCPALDWPCPMSAGFALLCAPAGRSR